VSDARRTDLPHVTEILRDAGLISTEWFTEEARDRGTAVHAAARYLDEGDLDRESLDPSVAPRLAQYEKFIAEVKPEILAIEEPVEHGLMKYCGTLDRRLRINGREAILDIKGIAASDWHGAQLALYAMCFPRPLARFNLYLFDDRYKLVERTDRADYGCATACLTIRNWRQNHV
jgi:hypothetical protein